MEEEHAPKTMSVRVPWNKGNGFPATVVRAAKHFRLTHTRAYLYLGGVSLRQGIGAPAWCIRARNQRLGL